MRITIEFDGVGGAAAAAHSLREFVKAMIPDSAVPADVPGAGIEVRRIAPEQRSELLAAAVKTNEDQAAPVVVETPKKEPKRTAKQRAAMQPPVPPLTVPPLTVPEPAAELAKVEAPKPEEISAVVLEYRDKVGGGSTAGIVAKLKALGVKRVTDLKPEDQNPFIAELRAEIAAK